MRQTTAQYRDRQDALALTQPLVWANGEASKADGKVYYRASTDGQYSICWPVLEPGVLMFEAWNRKTRIDFRGSIAESDKAACRKAVLELEQVCQAHAEKQR